MMKHDETCQWTILSAMDFRSPKTSIVSSNAVEATNLEGAVEVTHVFFRYTVFIVVIMVIMVIMVIIMVKSQWLLW